jgi:hypothetical protein
MVCRQRALGLFQRALARRIDALLAGRGQPHRSNGRFGCFGPLGLGGVALFRRCEGEDRTFGSGLFVDLVPWSCWFTNVRSCVDPHDCDRTRALAGSSSIC